MNQTLSISDCREFRRVIHERPTAATHISVLLCLLLVAGAVVFASFTEANLVVRANGRIRPELDPVQVFSGEAFNSTTGARVVEVTVKKGDVVNKGDVLIRLDTSSIDNEVSQLTRISTNEIHKLRRINELRVLVLERFEANVAKARAQLAHGRATIDLDRKRRESEIQLAQLNLDLANDVVTRINKIVSKSSDAISKQQQFQAEIKSQEASAELARVKAPIDDSHLNVLELAINMLERQHKAELAELDIKRDAQQGAIKAAELDLEKLMLAREQSVIRSTLTGVVISDVPQVGDIIPAGTPVVELAEKNGFQFHVEIPNDQVGDLKIGMPVQIKLDTFDYRQYGSIPGTVIFIAPDSEPRKDSRAAQSTYLVKIALDRLFVGDKERRRTIKLGLTGNVDITTGRELIASLVVRGIEKTISL